MWSWIRQIAVARSSDLNAIARIFINLYRVYYKLKNVIKKSIRKIVNSIAIRFHSLHQRLNCYIFSVSSKRSIRYKLKVVSVVFFVLNALTMSNRSNIIRVFVVFISCGASESAFFMNGTSKKAMTASECMMTVRTVPIQNQSPY